jgi:hypothetical protein
MRLVLSEKLVEPYFKGVAFAGFYFAQNHADWRNRLTDMATYSFAWPFTLTRDVLNVVTEQCRLIFVSIK